MNIIINADDFGYSNAITDGIAYAFRNGVVTSTSAMTNMPGIDYAADIYKDCEGLGLGVHLTLTAGRPILKAHKTIVDQEGKFFTTKAELMMREFIDSEEVYSEYEAQVEQFINVFGVLPDHVNLHHSVHTIEEVWNSLKKISEKYNLKIRGSVKGATYCPDFYGSDLSVDKFIEDINRYVKDGLSGIEFSCHPGFIDEYVYENSSYILQRINEINILTDDKVKDYLQKNKIHLTNFSKI